MNGQTKHYQNRVEAGRLLAQRVSEQLGSSRDVVVLGLPRGGVPVALEVARELGAPLDVVVVRKLGVPTHPEFALGAIASGGSEILDRSRIDRIGLSVFHVAAVADRELSELRRREAVYRAPRPLPDLRGRTALLVDDGIATGVTMRAAICTVRRRGAERVLVAIPVGDPAACERVSQEVDQVICPFRPDPFYAVGLWYRDYQPLSDATIQRLLAEATSEAAEPAR